MKCSSNNSCLRCLQHKAIDLIEICCNVSIGLFDSFVKCASEVPIYAIDYFVQPYYLSTANHLRTKNLEKIVLHYELL